MGKSTPSAPQAPDPSVVSQQQTASNVNTAVANSYLNRVNQFTPQGSLKYKQTGTKTVGGLEVPTWESVMEYSPAQQKLYDTGVGIDQGTADLALNYTKRIGDATKDPFSLFGMPTMGATPIYNDAYRKHQLQAIEDRNRPMMDRDKAALEQKLANQGISLGSEAWKNAQDDLNRGVNDFRLGADVQSGNSASQQFDLETKGWGNEGTARDRAISEMTLERSQPINEVAALVGTGKGVQQPTFTAVPQVNVAPTDVSGNYQSAYQGQLAQQQMRNSSNNATTGGLFGLGGTALAAGAMFM